MAFDSTEPADTSKIRNLGTVLRANFAAQLAGDTTYNPTYVNLATTSNPSATADMYRLYSKDVSSKAELHGRDEDGNVIQFTKAGKLGNTSLQTLSSGLSYDNSYFNVQDSHCTAWGVCANGTSLATGYKIATISKAADNTYTCTFSSSLSDANYAVCITHFNVETGDSTKPQTGQVITKSASSFTYALKTSTVKFQVGHMLMVFGGR